MSAIEELFSDETEPRRRMANCARCGSPAEYRVQVQVSRVNRAGKNLQGQMRSQSVRVCESCAVAAYGAAIVAAGNSDA